MTFLLNSKSNGRLDEIKNSNFEISNWFGRKIFRFSKVSNEKKKVSSLSLVFLINKNYFMKIIACSESKSRDPCVSKRGHEVKKTSPLLRTIFFFPSSLFSTLYSSVYQLDSQFQKIQRAAFKEKFVGTRSGWSNKKNVSNYFLNHFLKKCN